MDADKIRLAVKVLFIVGLVCFVFPYILVSCSGEEIEFSGMELMTKITFNEELEVEDDDPYNYYLIGAFVLGVIGLICAAKAEMWDKKMVGAAVCGLCGVILLIIFRVTFLEFYELDGYGDRIELEVRWGWVLTVLAYIGASVCAMVYQKMNS